MYIVSHQGYWENFAEKNTRVAFEQSFALGFGAETDVRDRDGELVISHDMADEKCMKVEELFEIYQRFGKGLYLALNIKADGLQAELKKLLLAYEVKNYFVFDMAVPDGMVYARKDFSIYTRHSDFETIPAYYELAQGIWLDEVLGHWITDDVIYKHLSAGKSVCIVSPELHKRDNRAEWEHYRDLEQKIGKDQLMLCTDFPKQAQAFFNE